MLELDLLRLRRNGRLEIAAAVPADDPVWQDSGLAFGGPVDIRLEAQQVGADVLVRGRLGAELVQECRRCLSPAAVTLDETVSILFRAGVTPVDAEQEEVYVLPAGDRALDLGPAVREQVLLAVPRFALCEPGCLGLCDSCGANRNRTNCTCGGSEPDPRWAALNVLKLRG